ncbi:MULTISPECIES: hypothetical protein [unclassified Mesorhizobium]|uniref:hypothetical protein n=1 Tax=Mesorhizobium sp. B3-2-1 TaxID=2589891 RepID=UPI001FEF7E75|nr:MULTISPECIES: hypothetical protein [unclassified Mesorhizobium]
MIEGGAAQDDPGSDQPPNPACFEPMVLAGQSPAHGFGKRLGAVLPVGPDNPAEGSAPRMCISESYCVRQPAFIEQAVIVDQGQPLTGRFPDAALARRRQSLLAFSHDTQLSYPLGVLVALNNKLGVICAIVVNNEHFPRSITAVLPRQTIQSSIENRRIIVRTNNDANFEFTAQDELLLLELPRKRLVDGLLTSLPRPYGVSIGVVSFTEASRALACILIPGIAN